jgi:hypothetical protein
VVAQPLRRAEELVALWLCVAPLRLGGLRGKKSTPSVWLGGTGELVAVGKQEQEQERLEHRNHRCKQIRPRYVPETSRVMHSDILLRLWLYCRRMLFPRPSYSVRKRGFS